MAHDRDPGLAGPARLLRGAAAARGAVAEERPVAAAARLTLSLRATQRLAGHRPPARPGRLAALHAGAGTGAGASGAAPDLRWATLLSRVFLDHGASLSLRSGHCSYRGYR